MAKCSQCGSRKAKRDCPGLGVRICPSCCAEGRLKTISCPETCSYLQGELYQHRRRKERAASLGRRFLEANRELFGETDLGDFAFKLQADIYYFLRREGAVDDAGVARSVEHLRSLFGPLYVPEASPHPLTRFLEARMGDERRYPAQKGPKKEERARVCSDLARFIRSRGGEGSLRYRDLISSFFDSLDFEADLDYSPEDEPADSPLERELPRTTSGLILPHSSQDPRRR